MRNCEGIRESIGSWLDEYRTLLTAVIAAQWTHSAIAGFAGGVVGAAAVAALFGLFAIVFAADQFPGLTLAEYLLQEMTDWCGGPIDGGPG